MEAKDFRPVVLVQHRASGFVNMFTRRYWDSLGERKHQTFHAVAFGNTPEESAKLWKVRDDINRVLKRARDA